MIGVAQFLCRRTGSLCTGNVHLQAGAPHEIALQVSRDANRILHLEKLPRRAGFPASLAQRPSYIKNSWCRRPERSDVATEARLHIAYFSSRLKQDRKKLPSIGKG